LKRLVLNAEVREGLGKEEARRLHRRGLIPAIVYGDKGEPIPVIVNPLDIEKILRLETGENTIFQLEVSGAETVKLAMLKDFQFDPVTSKLLHVDLIRVSGKTKLRVTVPIVIEGEAKGVEVDGGIMEFTQREVEVECLPQDIPEHITVNINGLEIGELVRVAELKVDEKVKILSSPEQVVISIAAPEVEEVVVAEEEEVPEEAKLTVEEKSEEEEEEKEE